jgi:hypothetical protein
MRECGNVRMRECGNGNGRWPLTPLEPKQSFFSPLSVLPG